MARLSAMALLLLVAALPAASAAPCADGDGRCAASALDQDDVSNPGLGLLQHQVGAMRALEAKKKASEAPNVTKVWAELKACVHIDALKAALKNLTSSDEAACFPTCSEAAKKLKGELSELYEQFPDHAKVKEAFSAEWANISQAVGLDVAVAQAKAKGSAKFEKLEAQFGNWTNSHIDAVQEHAAKKWKQLQDDGWSLPDLDDLTEQATELADQFKSSASEANGALQDMIGSNWSDLADQFQSSASDAASQAYDAVEDVNWSSVASQAEDYANSAGQTLGGLASSAQDAIGGWLR